MLDQRPLSGVLRRDVLVTLLAMGTLCVPALSETPIKIARVGYLTLAGRTGVIAESILPGFREWLQEKGYTEGSTLVLEQRYAEGDEERLPVFVSELLRLRLDVLFTVGTQVARAVQHATSTLPVVAITGEPVGAGLVRSLTRPGGNITGVALQNPEYSVKWLELLKEAVPNLQRVAVLWNPNNPTVALEIEAMRKAAPVLGLELSIFSGERSKLEASLGAIAVAALDGLVITDDAPQPLPPRVDERNAQWAFVQTLGAEAIWRDYFKGGPTFATAQLPPHLISRLHDSIVDISRAPGFVVGFVDHARRSVAPIGIEAAVMTAEGMCDASMTSDVRPAHCVDMTCAEPAHMSCADATEVCGAHAAEILSAEATDMGSTETAEMRGADATEMRSAESADMGSAYSAETAAKSADMTTAYTAAESAATASVSGARCGKSKHDDRCCCSENLRHDEPPLVVDALVIRASAGRHVTG
jgi:putative tryptophan/tyrosine transport system substrate-binding protein